MMNIYVANLAEYNNGKLVGDWISLPLAETELQKRLNDILGNDEELAIHDYECDYMEIGEYDNIFKLNEIAEKIDNMNTWEATGLKAMLENGSSFDEALENVEAGLFRVWNDCENMSHVAMEIENECGFTKEQYDMYLDIEALARDIEIEYCPEDEEDYPEDFVEYTEELIENGCISDEVKERYFDYESYGRDLDIEGTFIFINGDCVELF